MIQRCKWLWEVCRPNTTLSKKKTVFRGRQNMTLKVEGNTTKKATSLLLRLADLDCWICMSVSLCTIHRQTHTRRWHHRIFFPNISLIRISYMMVVYILIRLYTCICTHYLRVYVCVCSMHSICVRVCVKLFQSIKNCCHSKSESIKKTTWQKPIVFGMYALPCLYNIICALNDISPVIILRW